MGEIMESREDEDETRTDNWKHRGGVVNLFSLTLFPLSILRQREPISFRDEGREVY